MATLFSKKIVYPVFSDCHGCYAELDGFVMSVADYETGGSVLVRVRTPQGDFSAECDLRLVGNGVRPSDVVRVRVYDSGGGSYPDNRVVGWSRDRQPPPPAPPAGDGRAPDDVPVPPAPGSLTLALAFGGGAIVLTAVLAFGTLSVWAALR